MRKQVAVSYNTYTPGIHNEKDRVLYLHTLWYMYSVLFFSRKSRLNFPSREEQFLTLMDMQISAVNSIDTGTINCMIVV